MANPKNRLMKQGGETTTTTPSQQKKAVVNRQRATSASKNPQVQQQIAQSRFDRAAAIQRAASTKDFKQKTINYDKMRKARAEEVWAPYNATGNKKIDKALKKMGVRKATKSERKQNLDSLYLEAIISALLP